MKAKPIASTTGDQSVRPGSASHPINMAKEHHERAHHQGKVRYGTRIRLQELDKTLAQGMGLPSTAASWWRTSIRRHRRQGGIERRDVSRNIRAAVKEDSKFA